MGWFKPDESKELVVGDGGIDAVLEMLAAASREYEQDLGRKPTLDELLKTVEMVLMGNADRFLGGMEESEIVEVRAKTKKRAKKQKYVDGDFFSLPLPDARLGFGRVLDAKNFTFGFLRHASDAAEPISKLKDKPYAFITLCAEDGLTSWRWRVLGNVPLKPGEYEEPKLWVQDQLDPNKAQIYHKGEFRNTTADQARHLEPFRTWIPASIETRLLDEINRSLKAN
jgi:Immunity protein 26